MNQVGIGTFLGGVALLLIGIGPWWLAVGILVFGLLLIGSAAEQDQTKPERLKHSDAATHRLGSAEQPTRRRATATDKYQSGNDWLDVVGESFFDTTNRAIAYGQTGINTGRGHLQREPSNEADPNAVGVHLHGAGQVGYLTRDLAAEVCDGLDRRGGRVDCELRYARTEPDRYWSFTAVTDLAQLVQ